MIKYLLSLHPIKRLPMSHQLSRPLSVAALTFILTLTTTQSTAAPTKIHCTPTPKNGTQNQTLTTIWQQPAESEDFLLASISDAAFDQQGNLCLVDFRQKNVQVFDPDGAWLRTMGREGEGPGEFRDARSLFFNGDRYGVLQGFPAAIVWLNADGSPSDRVTVGGADPEQQIFVAVAHAVQSGPDIYAWVNRTTFTDGERESETRIARVAADGTLGTTIYSEPDGPSARTDGGIDEGKVYDIWLGRWTTDGAGGVWVAPERDRYVLQHWNAAGELVLEITRDYEPVVRNEAGQDAIRVWFQRRGWLLDQIHVGRTAPVVAGLRLGDDGNLWVRLGQGGRDPESDLFAVYDVLSPSGEYLEELRLHSDLVVDARHMLNDTMAVILATDPEDPHEEEAILALQKITATAP
jgi:hypothetical protein